MKNLMNHFLKGGLMLTLALLIFSCSETEDQMNPVAENTLKSIPEVLATLGENESNEDLNARKTVGNTYATFNAALGRSGLASVFARNNLTVFAPTDAAFAELGLNPGNIGRLDGLTNILLYHVIEGSVFSTDLVAGFVPTVQGAAVEISLSNGPMVNDANIIMVDKRARNGVIHGIDKVLLPPTENIVDIVGTNPDFSILNTAIEVAGIGDVIANANNITVFAPNNDAFVALLGELNYGSLDELVGDIGINGLINVLTYHVFTDGRVFSSDLSDGNITMFSGDQLTVDTSGPKLIDINNRESQIIATDIQATNGVVHVIDRVVLNL